MKHKIFFTVIFCSAAAVLSSCSGQKDPSNPFENMFIPDDGIYGYWISGSDNVPPRINFIPTVPVPQKKIPKLSSNGFQILRIYRATDSAGKPVAKYTYCRQWNEKNNGTKTHVTEGSGNVFVLSAAGPISPFSLTAFTENEALDQYWNVVSPEQKSKHLLIFNAGNTNTLADCTTTVNNCDLAVVSGGVSGIGNVFYRANSHKTKSVIDAMITGGNTNPFYDNEGIFQFPQNCTTSTQ